MYTDNLYFHLDVVSCVFPFFAMPTFESDEKLVQIVERCERRKVLRMYIWYLSIPLKVQLIGFYIFYIATMAIAMAIPLLYCMFFFCCCCKSSSLEIDTLLKINLHSIQIAFPIFINNDIICYRFSPATDSVNEFGAKNRSLLLFFEI